MRTLPSRYLDPKPVRVKKVAAQVAHISAPLKGLNLTSKLTTGDPMAAPILTNFVVEDDRISVRAGYRKIATVGGGFPTERLIPWYGGTGHLAAAVNGGVYNAEDGTLIKGGFSPEGNDWSYCAFSNLGEKDYTVMVNGVDGVWSWDGGLTTTDPPAVNCTLSAATPCVATVAAADITKFQNGMTVVVAGAVGSYTTVNGSRLITNVNSPPNTITLVGTNTSGATGTNTATINAPATAGMVKETIVVPTAEPWINPQSWHIVVPHMNRLFFADASNLAVYYLPLMQKNCTVASGVGSLGVLPLNALFRRGGSIRAMASWTVEGGVGTNDQLVIFSSNGEAVIYQGTNPDDPDNWSLTGIFRFDAPINKHCVVNWAGDLWVLISTGLVSLAQLLRAETESLGQIDKSVMSYFLGEAIKNRVRPGWQAFINPSSNRVFCNVPQGFADSYVQMVRHMPRPVWSQWQDIPARCWAWIDPYVYFGDDKGNIYQMHPVYLSDDGEAIRIDVQAAWSLYKTPGIKAFRMLRTYTISDAVLRPRVDVLVDYDQTPPVGKPDVTVAGPGTLWDVADWDDADWASTASHAVLWQGTAGLGRVGAPRLTALIKDAHLSITGWDVLYEAGAAL